MRQTQALPTLIALIALAVATTSLLGGRAAPATASSLAAQIEPAAVLGGGFTYQGSLSRGGQLVDGVDACDLRFTLWDAASGGAQQGSTQTVSGVDFTQGLFTLTVNEGGQFGPVAFGGEARWLEVEVACPRGSAYTSLGRQAISAVPYATHSGSTAALQGRPLSSSAPSAGQVLGWDGSAWGPVEPSATQLQGRPVSASAPETGQVLAWDGSAWAPAADKFGVQYQRTVIVSPADTPAASGTSLLGALAAITDASAEKPYLLKIEPGVYDLGDASLQMKPYVDIEGSGEGLTRITAQGAANFEAMGTVRGTNNAELRLLMVENTGGAAYAAALVNRSASLRLMYVSLRAGGGTVNYGIYNAEQSSLNLYGVSLRLTYAPEYNYGMYNTGGSSLTIGQSTIIVENARLASYGVISQGGTASVYSSRISAVPPVEGSNGGTVRIAHSLIDSRGSFASGAKCIGAYNASFAPLSEGCN